MAQPGCSTTGKEGFITVKSIYYGERGLHRREKVLPGGKRSFINVKPIDYGKMGLYHRAVVLLRGKGASSSCSHLVHPVQSFPVQQEHAGAINPRGISKQFTIPHQSRVGNSGQFTIPHQSRAGNSGQFTIPHQSVPETPDNLQYLFNPVQETPQLAQYDLCPLWKTVLKRMRDVGSGIFIRSGPILAARWP